MTVPIKVDLIKKAKRPGYAMKPEYVRSNYLAAAE